MAGPHRFTIRDRLRFWRKVNRDGPLPDQSNPHYAGLEKCWVWTGGTGGCGYGRFKVRGRSFRAHRASYLMEHDAIPDGLDVLHRCDVRLCVNPAHLWPGTDTDNSADKEMKGRGNKAHGDAHGSRLHPERMARGESQHLAKLTAEKVVAMRATHSAGGITYVDLGRFYGVSGANAQCVVTRKTWAHVA